MAASKLVIQLRLAIYCLASSMVAAAEVERQTVGSGTWCVAKEESSSTDLQAALDWACGQESGQGNVNCAAISSGGLCDSPDTLVAHASYAFNAYFQSNNQAAGSCDFADCAQTTTIDPSLGACTYSSSPTSSFLTTGNVSNSTPTNTATVAKPVSINLMVIIATIMSSFFLPTAPTM